MTILFNTYYKKNRKIDGIAVEMKGNMDYQWKADLNWIFKPTQRDTMDAKRWKIVQLIYRDTDLLKWYLSKGDLYASESHKEIKQFIELIARGMEKLSIDKDYFKIFKFKTNLEDLNKNIFSNDDNDIIKEKENERKEEKKKKNHRNRKNKKKSSSVELGAAHNKPKKQQQQQRLSQKNSNGSKSIYKQKIAGANTRN